MTKEIIAKFYLTYRLYIFPAVVALSSLFLIVFAIYPQTVKLLDNQRLSSDLKNKTKFLEDKVVALESYDTEDLSRKVELVLTSYPADKDFGNILGILQGLASQYGLNIISASLGGGSSKLGNTESYTVRFEIEGPGDLLSSFLYSLENSPRLTRLKSIDVSSGSSAMLSATMSVEVLYAQAPQTFGSVDSPLPELNQKDDELLVSLAATKPVPAVSTVSAQPTSPRGKSNPFE